MRNRVDLVSNDRQLQYNLTELSTIPPKAVLVDLRGRSADESKKL